MSSTTLYVFRSDGLAEAHTTFRNSHGSAPRVWRALCEKYIHPIYPQLRVFRDVEKLFEIQESLPLKDFEVDLLHWTADRFILKSEYFTAMADSFDKFELEYPCPGYANHLPAIAELMRKFKIDEPDVQAIAFQQTSVAEDMWYVFETIEHPVDPEYTKDEDRPYDLNKDTNHFFYEPGISR